MRSFLVQFELQVDDDETTEEGVEEAVTALLDEEVMSHENRGTRCGVSFHDVLDVTAVEEK